MIQPPPKSGGAGESGHDIVSEVLSAARRAPEAVAIIDGRGRTVTYGELARRVRTVRSALGPLEPGEAVLFAVRPGPEAVVTAVGAVAAGGMITIVDPGLAPAVLAGRLAAARPGWVIAESLLYLLSGPLRPLARRRGLTLPRLADPLPGRSPRHLHTGPWLPGVPRGALSLRRLPPTDHADPPADPGRPAVVVFTSGTTGRPKGVVHTSESLARGAAMLREVVPLGPGDVVHTDQLMLGLPALMSGATWSLPGDPGRYLAELAERNATHAFCVPVRLAAMLAPAPDAKPYSGPDSGPDSRPGSRPGDAPRLPPGLRHLLLGTAPAPPAVLRRAVAAGPHVNILSVYAMTEALPIAVATAAEKLAALDGDLLGRPLPGVGVRFAADGELFVSGPHLARRYLGGPPLTEVATGDLVRLDADGRLVLLGRRKDMLLRDGFNIYPGLYEPAIAALPGVAEAAIVGLADPETGDEEVVLAVVPDSSGFDETRLRRALPEIVDVGALPDRVVVLDALPRSGRTEKIDRAALRAALHHGPSAS